MTTYNSVKRLSRSSLHWCATFGNRETRRLPNWSCFRSSMHCFHVLQRFVADEDFGSLTMQQPGGSFVASICILFDEFVFWWCTCDWQEVLQRIGPGAMQFSCTGHHPVLGTWTHRAQTAPSHEACWGFQQTSTRRSCQDLWRCQFLWAWCMGAHWLWRPGPYQAQTTIAHLRVNCGVASMLRLVAHHPRYQTLQANWDLATCRATFSGSLRCCIRKPMPRYRRIFGSVAWWPQLTAWSLCFNHPSIGVPPLGTGRQEDCPTGAASGPICIVFSSVNISWPKRTLVHWQYSGAHGSD